MRAKANEIAALLHKQAEFKANNGWFQRFKTRNSIQLAPLSASVEAKSGHGSRLPVRDSFVRKNGPRIDEEDEANFTDENTATSDEPSTDLNADLSVRESDYDEEEDEGADLFDESDYDYMPPVNSYEVPSRQEALGFLYKLRMFFENNTKSEGNDTEGVHARSLVRLDELENELLKG